MVHSLLPEGLEEGSWERDGEFFFFWGGGGGVG